jgi:hypothetical protein
MPASRSRATASLISATFDERLSELRRIAPGKKRACRVWLTSTGTASLPRHLSSGAWCIYIQREGGKRLLDGEATDSANARLRFHQSIRDEPVTTLVELVNPSGTVVDHSQGAYTGRIRRSSTEHPALRYRPHGPWVTSIQWVCPLTLLHYRRDILRWMTSRPVTARVVALMTPEHADK